MQQNSDSPSRLRFLVSTLPGWPDVRLLRAAARAGATAVLNLEAVANPAAALAALTAAPAVGRIGVRVDSADALATLHGCLATMPALRGRLDAIVVTPDAVSEEALARVREPGRALLLECTSIAHARLGARLLVDGLIVKGHESGGMVGEETTFVLLQRVLAEVELPVYAHGGIGPRTIAACLVAGCDGVVLDAQLLLARESSLDDAVKSALERMAGDETLCLGSDLGTQYRVYKRPGLTALKELAAIETDLSQLAADEPDVRSRWRAAITARISWASGPGSLWPIGQDAAFAAELATRHRSVGGILTALAAAAVEHVETARALTPLAPGAPLAVAHGTDFPILQGPMTRVSDTVGFAAAVAEGGALPFLALALLRGPQVRTLLQATSEQLGARPWGVGILGFVPLELREEQLAVIEAIRPKFALIAGGRPDQAAKLERLGITTYLHVPAPSLLKMFLEDGARRFIFEGRECGGHVGPRTSFVLWELMVTGLLAAIARGVPAEQLHVVFAGGIHDARSAAMVAAIAAPLAKAGVRVGALIGTAYLFTEEAVTSGAIVDAFQKEAIECSNTVLLETGPGHATRCAETPFCDTFRETRRQLGVDGRSPDEIRFELESLNLGRLRVASKGIRREQEADGRGSHVAVGVDEQRQYGMYMIGQVAALRRTVCRVRELHTDVSDGSTALLAATVSADVAGDRSPAAALSASVAIIGMGCLLPDAQNVRTLWNNVLERHDAIREVPKDRFDSDLYYDADRKARDRIYSKWGGFLDELAFDPLKHGIPPTAMPSIDPFQLLTLEVVDQALKDAGYADRPYNKDRTSVILGASGGVGDLGFRYGIRAGLPMFLDETPAGVLERLPEWTEDSFAGVLLNVAAGRVANRLDLGGLNFTVDAACASSLAAVFLAARELEAGSSDMVLVGGIDTVNSPFGYLCFSSAQALSPRGRCSTFDETADGIAISEGLTVLVLKRLDDAERDGDRVYAVIRAVAGSSDGRGKGLSAPRPEGQVRVLERAYAVADISPATVGLIEAHGTGTVAGDGAEVSALSKVFAAADAGAQSCAIGSIKSMIGHTKSAAGVSGLLKVALALHHKVLPPTIHVTRPNAKLRGADTPFYVNTEARPWLAPEGHQPRRAGVSSFGFGGTNFHVVLEEYDSQAVGVQPERAVTDEWPAELFVWSAPTSSDLAAALERLDRAIDGSPDIPLRVVAASVCRTAAEQGRPGDLRVAIVAERLADLRAKLAVAREALAAGRPLPPKTEGIYLGSAGAAPGQVAFIFPGQGSQYPGMHRGLATHFADVRHALEAADVSTSGIFPRRLSTYVFPPSTFTPQDEDLRMRELTDTAVAQPALGAMEMGLVRLLQRLGVRPDLLGGHSYGEYVALWAGGAYSDETLMNLSVARGAFMKRATAENAGTMAAVGASPERIASVVGDRAAVWIANLNSPRQTVIAGSVPGIEAATRLLQAAEISTRRIPVACAFHSPLVKSAQEAMAALLERTAMETPHTTVFANTTAAPYPDDPARMREVLAEHLVSPVRFREQIDAMYAAGARTFVEVGPKGVLSNLMRETLTGRDALIVPLNAADKPEIAHLLRALAQLVVAGVPVALSTLWQGRSIPQLRLEELRKAVPAAPPAHAWMVNGGRARPLTPRISAPAPASRPVVVAAAAASPAVPVAASAPPVAPSSPPPAAPVAVHLPPTPPATVAGPPAGMPMRGRSVPRSLPLSFGGTMHAQILSGAERSADQHEVVRQFQQLMSQFLQTQALVMTTYLQGVPQTVAAPVLQALAPPAPRPELPVASMPTVSTRPAAISPAVGANGGSHHAAPVAYVPPPAPVMAPPPVVAAAPRPAAPPPVPAPVAPAPAPVAVAPVEAPRAAEKSNGNGHGRLTEPEVLRELLRIVSDRTGYPQEMLTVDANIESDLGIDSIKRMEILAAFHEAHGGAERGAFQDALERLTALKTLRESASALAEFLAAQPATAAV